MKTGLFLKRFLGTVSALLSLVATTGASGTAYDLGTFVFTLADDQMRPFYSGESWESAASAIELSLAEGDIMRGSVRFSGNQQLEALGGIFGDRSLAIVQLSGDAYGATSARFEFFAPSGALAEDPVIDNLTFSSWPGILASGPAFGDAATVSGFSGWDFNITVESLSQPAMNIDSLLFRVDARELSVVPEPIVLGLGTFVGLFLLLRIAGVRPRICAFLRKCAA